MDCAKYTQQRNLLKQQMSNIHPTFQNLTNRQLLSIIQGQKDQDIDPQIYKNIYQYIKLYIVTTGRFAT